MLKKTGYRSWQMMHVVDWLPSLVAAAGGAADTRLYVPGADGLNLWTSLEHNETSPRKEILHDLNPVTNSTALRVGAFKILWGATEEKLGGWYSGSEQRGTGDGVPADALVHCPPPPARGGGGCKPSAVPCLFNIELDPCEQRNLAEEMPQMLAQLQARVTELQAGAAACLNDPVNNPNAADFPAADPKNFGGVWSVWDE